MHFGREYKVAAARNSPLRVFDIADRIYIIPGVPVRPSGQADGYLGIVEGVCHPRLVSKMLKLI